MIGQVIEVTVVLVAMYMILNNAENFSTAANAVGENYVKMVQVLQGPGK